MRTPSVFSTPHFYPSHSGRVTVSLYCVAALHRLRPDWMWCSFRCSYQSFAILFCSDGKYWSGSLFRRMPSILWRLSSVAFCYFLFVVVVVLAHFPVIITKVQMYSICPKDYFHMNKHRCVVVDSMQYFILLAIRPWICHHWWARTKMFRQRKYSARFSPTIVVSLQSKVWSFFFIIAYLLSILNLWSHWL